jgi:hypothetical protein
MPPVSQGPPGYKVVTARSNRQVHSLTQVLEAPAVDALLTAADSVMNSNTLLIGAYLDEPLTSGNQKSALETFLRSPLFPAAMRTADAARDWGNLRSGPIVRPQIDLQLSQVSEAGFHDLLHWMLREAFSPYQHHLDATHAKAVIDTFMSWLHHDATPPVGNADWEYWSARPDFMYTSGYYSNEPPQTDAAYFDGGSNDTATFLHRGNVLMLLLTNGSP